MLKIIEPQDHTLYKSIIDSFLSLLKKDQEFVLPQEAQGKATFIIAEDEKQGVYGGAVIYQQNVTSLHQKIAKVLLTLQPQKQEAWLAKLSVCIAPDDKFLTLDTLNRLEDFYQSLYKVFLQFGSQKNINFLVLSLFHSDYRNTKTYGHWPYILDIYPRDFSDFYFHGLLPLTYEEKKRDADFNHSGDKNSDIISNSFSVNTEENLNRQIR